METTLAHIKLKHIVVSKSNEMFRAPEELTREALTELIESIKESGVIQPVRLRPLHKAGKDQIYELICGERRFRASFFEGLDSIPANISPLTDEEAFTLQITENLQRKDVHPLKEAYAYKYLVDQDPKTNTSAELALKFGKTEHYIQTRLKLNDLVPEARKDFAENIMSIGHALIIARLTPDDQKSTIERCTETFTNQDKKKVRVYNTIHDLQEHINDSVICNLNTAAFKKDDATLLPKAGACSTCPKRSGASQLFADVSDKDRCFDPTCFMAKRMKYLISQIPTILEKNPDIAFLQTHRNNAKVDPEVSKLLKEHKVKVLQPGPDFETYNYNKAAKIKGIYINGDEVGKNVIVFSSKVKETSTGNKADDEKVNVKEAIARIDERLERSIELDEEKVYGRILEELRAHPTQTQIKADVAYVNSSESIFLMFILWDKLGYAYQDEVTKALKMPDDEDDDYSAKLYHRLSKLTADEKTFLIRKVMMNCYGNNSPKSNYAYIIRQIALAYGDIPIKLIEKEQAEIRAKREANAAERKRQLQPAKAEKKGAPAKRAPAKSIGKGLAALLNDEPETESAPVTKPLKAKK